MTEASRPPACPMKRLEPQPAGNDAGTKRKLSSFARRLSVEWKQLALPIMPEERIVVAVSGGADSTALLLAFDELVKAGRMSLRLKVAHLDHGLRGAAGAEDARWVGELAGELGHEFVTERVSVGQSARETRDNLEQAARRARYEFLGRAARETAARVVAAAHTLDDQAETMLLALMRGSGAEGLSGMRPVRALDAGGDVVLLARPLLGWARRAETVGYCAARGVAVRVDEMNEDESFSRVRVRRRLLPLLETFNPRAIEALGRTARLLRADAEALEAEAARLLEKASERELKDELEDEMSAMQTSSSLSPPPLPPLSVEVLRGADAGVRRRALRQWLAAGRGSLRRVELVHVSAVEKLLEVGRGGRVAELPGGSRVERRRGQLIFQARGNETGKS